MCLTVGVGLFVIRVPEVRALTCIEGGHDAKYAYGQLADKC